MIEVALTFFKPIIPFLGATTGCGQAVGLCTYLLAEATISPDTLSIEKAIGMLSGAGIGIVIAYLSVQHLIKTNNSQSAELSKIHSEHDVEIARINDAWNARLEANSKSHAERLDKLNVDHAKRMDELTAAYSKQLTTADERYHLLISQQLAARQENNKPSNK